MSDEAILHRDPSMAQSCSRAAYVGIDPVVIIRETDATRRVISEDSEAVEIEGNITSLNRDGGLLTAECRHVQISLERVGTRSDDPDGITAAGKRRVERY